MRTAEIPLADKCSHCIGAKCCTYITQTLDTPRSKADFHHLLWQISHQGIEAYKDETGWYLLIQGNCSHLLPDGRCGIYGIRPPICREYDNDYCELDEPAEANFDLYFRNYNELLNYCHKRYKRWDS